MDFLDKILLHLIADEFFRPLLVLEIGEVEPRLKCLPLGEDVGHEEVQEGP